jgi:hypothetical protein
MEDQELRTRAAVLAATAEITQTCADHSVVLESLAGTGLDLQLLGDRCAVVGTWDGGSAVGVGTAITSR